MKIKIYLNAIRSWRSNCVIIIFVSQLIPTNVFANPKTALKSSGVNKTINNSPDHLKVNLRTEPIGIDSHPNFTWDAQTRIQTAYQVQVAVSIDNLKKGKLIWDSGKINSAADNQISYQGPVELSATRYYWRVCVWGENKIRSAWSEPSFWETGLLQKSDWGNAKWIGGRNPQDHNWTDMTATINFRIKDAATGITFLFHALPIGKVWSEAYSYRLMADPVVAKNIQLVENTLHYAGNTGVPNPTPGERPVQMGLNYFDPQSETNPLPNGTRTVAIATISRSNLGGVTSNNIITQDHQLKIKVSEDTVTVWLDGNQIDRRTLSGDQLRKNGSIGFLNTLPAGRPANIYVEKGPIIHSVKIEVPTPPVEGDSTKRFYTDFDGGVNPFEAGEIIYPGLKRDTINDGLVFTNKSPMLPIANPVPILRKEFQTSGNSIKSARLYVAGGSYPIVCINGKPLTIDGNFPEPDGHNIPHLTPDDGQSDRFILYNTYDVTRFIQPGKPNVISAQLGRGWTGVTVPDEWYWNNIPAHGAPRTIAKLIITHTDGSIETIVSGTDWKTTDGPTTFESVYTGEKYDARIAKLLGNWTAAGYDDRSWNNASEMNPIGSYYGTGKYHGAVPATRNLPEGFVASKLKAMENEPIVVRDVFKPIAISETFPGSKVYLFKFAQMHSGWIKIHLKNINADKAGLTLRMRADNIITGAGTAADPYTLSNSNAFIAGDLQTDYYTLSDDPEQTWTASFHYNGQGGIEMQGLYDILGRAPDIMSDQDLITAEVASSGFSANNVTTSNTLLNQIKNLSVWAMRNNAHGHPTDTPSREKNGWTGDGWADAEAWIQNFDVSQFYRLWVRDMSDGMNSEGDLNVLMPGPRAYGFDKTPGWANANGAIPAWDAAFFELPWELYEYYGDVKILEELYPAQIKCMNYYGRRFTEANDYTYAGSALGEYGTGTLGQGNPVNINHQLYYLMADYMSKVAEILGQEDRKKQYRNLADKILAAYVKLYWDDTQHTFSKGNSGNLETEQLMAVAFNMVPGNDLAKNDPRYLASTTNTQSSNQKSCMAMVANSLTMHANRIGTGVYGLRYLFNLLDEYGYKDLAYTVATGLENPSWGNILKQGGTTLQESWGGISGDHHYHSSIVTWYYQGLAGIKPTSPGYATLKIKPFIPTNVGNTTINGNQALLTWVNASINTARGLVRSAWNNDAKFKMNVTIPNNTQAEVWVPLEKNKISTVPIEAKYLRYENGYSVYQIGSGSYEFQGMKVATGKFRDQ